jgi:hypothetical protein
MHTAKDCLRKLFGKLFVGKKHFLFRLSSVTFYCVAKLFIVLLLLLLLLEEGEGCSLANQSTIPSPDVNS